MKHPVNTRKKSPQRADQPRRLPLWQRGVALFSLFAMEFVPFTATIDGVLNIRFVANAAYAAGPIVDPYAPIAFQPKVTNSSTGAPVVNIATPNAAGLSHNRFQRFDVDATGLILNNSLYSGGTLIGGHVLGNPNLNGRSASVILNEITSTGSAFASFLGGTIEVFGAPAHVILANPNGIACAGCGFVNTPRITLTTGIPQLLSSPDGTTSAFDLASALAFDVGSGHIEIDSSGIDSTASRIDLIAETMTLGGAVSADLSGGASSQINLIAGRNRVTEDAQGNLTIRQNAAIAPSSGTQQAFAIDASALGALNAGQIRILATNDGLGVKTDGALAATTGNLTIDSNGQIRIGNAYANKQINLKGKGDVAVSGSAIAQQESTLTSVANVVVSGAVETAARLSIDAARSIELSGVTRSMAETSISAGDTLRQAPGGNIQAGTHLSINTGGLTHLGGSISSMGDTTIVSGGRLTQGAGSSVATGAQLIVTAAGAELSGQTRSTTSTSIRTTDDFMQSAGSNIEAGTYLTINAGQHVDLGGTSRAAADTSITAGGNIAQGTSGNVETGARLLLQAARDVALSGSTRSVVDTSISADGAFSQSSSGSTLAGTQLNINAGKQIHLSGTSGAMTDTVITAGESLTQSTGSLLEAGARLSIEAAQTVALDGSVLSLADTSIRSGGSFMQSSSGSVQSGARLVLGATEAVDLRGVTLAVGDTSIHSGSVFSQSGQLLTGGNYQLSAAEILTPGSTHADGIVDLDTSGAAVIGDLSSASSINIAANGNVNGTGQISAPGGIVLTSRSGGIQSSAAILSNANVTLRAANHVAVVGTLNTPGSIELSAGGSASLTGQTKSGNGLNVTAMHDLTTGGTLDVTGALTLQSGGNVHIGGLVSVSDHLDVNAAGDLSTGGVTLAGAGAHLSGGGALHLNGDLAVNGDVTLSAVRDIVTTKELTVLGQATVTSRSGRIDNQGGLNIQQDLLASAATDLTVAGNVLVLGNVQASSENHARLNGDIKIKGDANFSVGFDLTIDGETLINGTAAIAATSGSITGSGNISTARLQIGTGANMDLTGDLGAVGTIDLTAAGRLSTTGALVSGGNLTQRGFDVSNSGSTLTFGNVATHAQRDAATSAAMTVLGSISIDAGRDISVSGVTQVVGDAALQARGGSLLLSGDHTLHANAALNAQQSLAASGSLRVARQLALTSGTHTDIDAAVVAGDSLVVNAGSMSVDGSLRSLGDLAVTARAGDFSLVGSAEAKRNTTVRVFSALNGTGQITAGDGATLDASRIDYTGTLHAGNAVSVFSLNDARLGSIAAADGAVALVSQSGALDVTGKVIANGNIGASARNNLATRDELVALGSGAISLTSEHGTVTSFGILNASNDISLRAAVDVLTNASIAAQRDVTVSAGRHLISSGAIVAGRVDPVSGVAAPGGSVNLMANESLTTAGQISAQRDAVLSANNVTVQKLSGGAGIGIDARQSLTLTGAVTAKENINLHAGTTLSNTSAVSAGRALSVSAATVNNTGSLFAADGLSIGASSINNAGSVYGSETTVTASDLNNSNGQVLARDRLSVTVNNLNNASGQIAAEDNANLTVRGIFSNVGGKIQSARGDLALDLGANTYDPSAAGSVEAGDMLTITAQSIANSAGWTPNAKGLSLNIQSDFSNAGTIQLDGDFRVNTNGNIANSGEIRTGGSIALLGNSVTNSNLLKADRNIELGGNVTNRGSITAGVTGSTDGGDVRITGAAFDNSFSSLRSERDLTINVTGALTNVDGRIEVGGNTDLRAASINNDRAEPVELGATTRSYNASLLDAIVLGADTATGWHWEGGRWVYGPYAAGTIDIADLSPNYTTNSVTVRDPVTRASVSIGLPQTVRSEHRQNHGRGASLLVTGDATISTGGTISNRGSEIKVGGNLTLSAASLDNGQSSSLVNGVVETTDNAGLTRFVDEVNTARRAGQHIYGLNPATGRFEYFTPSAYTVNPASSGSYTTTAGLIGTLQVGGNTSIALDELKQGGVLTSRGDLAITSSLRLTNDGLTAAGGDLTLVTPEFTNNVGAKLLSFGAMRLGSDAQAIGNLTNDAGSIEAGGNLSIRAGSIVNRSSGTSTTEDYYLLPDRQNTLTQYAEAINADASLTDAVRYALLNPETGGARVYNSGSGRIKIYSPTSFYMDSGLEYLEIVLGKTTHGAPAVISGANVDIRASGGLNNAASLVHGAGSLNLSAASLSNSAGLNTYLMTAINCRTLTPCSLSSTSEFSNYTVTAPSAGALQAGSALRVEVAGSIVNTGNLYGQAVGLRASDLTNGLTDPSIPALASSAPNAVINLATPNIGRGILDARDIIVRSTATAIESASGRSDPLSAPSVGASLPTFSATPTTPSVAGVTTKLSAQAQPTQASILTGNALQPQLSATLIPSTQPFSAPATPHITQPVVFSGANPSATGSNRSIEYLYRSPASNLSPSLSPQYLVDLLPTPAVPSGDLLFFADPYVEAQLLRSAALQQTGRALFVNGAGIDDQGIAQVVDAQRQALYAQAALFAQQQGVALGQALSAEQQALLDAPMLWYVEQQVPDGHGGSIAALVPTLYLPEVNRSNLTQVAGGLIQGHDVNINVAGTLTNTGYIVGQNVSIEAGTLIQEKRQGDIGRLTEKIKGGYVATTGTTVQPGAFISAANLDINTQRIESISGEFQVLRHSAEATQTDSQVFLDTLRAQLGAEFIEREAQNHLRQEVFVRDDSLEQIAIAVVGIAVAIYTGGAAAGAMGLTQGTASYAIASATVGSMASSAVTGALSGNFSLENVLKAGLTGGLTAGLTSSLGLGSMGLDQAGNVADWGTRIVGHAGRAVVGASVNSAINGGSFEDAFTTAFIGGLAADGAKWIGDNTGADGLFGAEGSVGHVFAHAALGCAAAAATDKDCASGATGAAAAALLSPVFDQLDIQDRTLREATVTGVGALVGGLATSALGGDASVALNAATNTVQNNYLKHDELLARFKAQMACDQGDPAACSTRDALDQLSAKRQEQMGSGCERGVAECRQMNWQMEQDLATLQFYEQELRERAVAVIDLDQRRLLNLHAEEAHQHQRQVAANLKTNYSVLADDNTASLEWQRVQQLTAQYGGSEILAVFGASVGTGRFARQPPRDTPAIRHQQTVLPLPVGSKPPGVPFTGTLYRYENPARVETTWDIHPGNVAANHRYSGPGDGATYGGTSPETALAEVTHYGVASGRVLVSRPVRLHNVLDLTNPTTRNQIGVSAAEISGDSYEMTQRIGIWARQNGYDGVLAPSARNPSGTNLVLFPAGRP